MIDAPSRSRRLLAPWDRVRPAAMASTTALPSEKAWRFGRSPACGPPASWKPCFLLSGLKCPPAEVNGDSHWPTAWRWNPCGPGGRPLRSPLRSTPWGVSVRVIVPIILPSRSFICAVALSPVAEYAAEARPSAQTTLITLRSFMASLLSGENLARPEVDRQAAWVRRSGVTGHVHRANLFKG